MKKILKLMAVIFTAAIMSSCSGEEVNQRSFVQLMGIEKYGEAYVVSMQLYNSESSDGSHDISKANAASVTGSGTTIYEAIDNAGTKTGKSLFLGHIKLIILGSGLGDPTDELSAFLDSEISPSCPVVYSSRPQSITDTFLEEGLYSADKLLKNMDSYVKSGKCLYTSIASIEESISIFGASSAVPVICSENDEISFSGAAFAGTDGIRPVLSEDDTTGFKLLLGDFRRGDKYTIPVMIGDKAAAAVITHANTKNKASVEDGRLHINSDITLKITIPENPFELSEKQISEAVCRSVRDSSTSAFSTSVWYEKSDVFHIQKLIRKYCPEFLEAYNNDKEQILKDCILNINVKARTA